MADVRAERYGRTGGARDARADRTLRGLAWVLGVLALGAVVWIGWSYVAGQAVSGQLVTWKVDSAHAVEAHLEIHKGAGDTGVCTVRSLSRDGTEVGRKDVPVSGGKDRIDTVVTLRTTARASSVELVGCGKQAG